MNSSRKVARTASVACASAIRLRSRRPIRPLSWSNAAEKNRRRSRSRLPVDAVGTVVDIVMNPVSRATSGDAQTAATLAMLLSMLNDRGRYSNTVDSVLYDSADSYAQARLLYLQNRRFELSRGAPAAEGAAADEGFIDPYEE